MLDNYLLESSRQCSVLFHAFLEFVQGGRSDTLDVSAGQGRLEHVGRIEASGCAAGSDDRVELVDEQDHVRIRRYFVDYVLESLLEISAIFGTCDDGAEIQRYEPFAFKHRRDVSVDDLDGDSFHDGGFADSGITDEHRIVLPSASENLDDALYLVLSSHERIQPSFTGGLCYVVAELFERGCLLLLLFGYLTYPYLRRLLLFGALSLAVIFGSSVQHGVSVHVSEKHAVVNAHVVEVRASIRAVGSHQCKQQVLRSSLPASELGRFKYREAQDVLRAS